jgi:hypothetical protein
MAERRKSRRYVLEKAGHIIIGAESHKCVVYDRSITGARLVRYGNLKLPKIFLLDVGLKKPLPCWLIWQAEGEAGVAFEEPKGH